MKNRRILINGAGIAGPTLAYWLDRYGFEPTLVERAPAPRGGGYIVDFWGSGFAIAEKMGLAPALRARSVPIEELKIVDGDGRRCGGFPVAAMRSLLGDRFISLLRSDLALQIYQALGDRVPVRFGDTVTRIEQAGGGVRVLFRRGDEADFDLVIGAGGLHSPVRGLVFGHEDRFERFLGYYVASFATDDYPHQDPHEYVGYAEPGRQVTRYTLADGRTIFLLVFAAPGKLAVGHHGAQAAKELLRREFAGVGWECAEILDRLRSDTELYFDAVSQIEMSEWTRGRAALVGDACGCPSLLAGEGASLAMAGAYILAGELKRAGGDHRNAFARYERAFHPVVAHKQRAARRFARSFVPRTRTGIYVRNQVTRMMRVPLVARLAFGGLLKDSMTLPAYETN